MNHKALFKRRLMDIAVGVEPKICPFDNVPMYVSGCGNPHPGALITITGEEHTCPECGYIEYIQTIHAPSRIIFPSA